MATGVRSCKWGIPHFQIQLPAHFCKFPKSRLAHVLCANRPNTNRHFINNKIGNNHMFFKNFSTASDQLVFTLEQPSNKQEQEQLLLETIYKYCAKARFALAIDMVKNNPNPKFVTPILRALEKRNQFPYALSLYRTCNAANIRLDEEGYANLFKVERRWKRYVHLWLHYNDMIKSGIAPNSTILNTLLLVCVETQNFGMATHLFGEIQKNIWDIPLDEIDMNAFIKTFADSQQLEHAFCVLEFMREKRLELSLKALISLATACFTLSSLYGKRLHEFIINNKIPIDWKLKICLVRVYAPFHIPSEVVEILKTTKIPLEDVVCAYMVHAAEGGKIHPDANKLFKDEVDIPALLDFVKRYCGEFSQLKSPIYDGLLKLFEYHRNTKAVDILFRGTSKNTDNWNTMMELLIKRKDFVQVIDLLDRMSSKPNGKTFATVRIACSSLFIQNGSNKKSWNHPFVDYLMNSFTEVTTANDIKKLYESYSKK